MFRVGFGGLGFRVRRGSSERSRTWAAKQTNLCFGWVKVAKWCTCLHICIYVYITVWFWAKSIYHLGPKHLYWKLNRVLEPFGLHHEFRAPNSLYLERRNGW